MSGEAIVSMILAAGRGVRMRSGNVPKVCVPVGGIPAIVRAIQAYDAAGVRRHLAVVGHLAPEVVRMVGEVREDVLYVYQKDLLGTGHAARTGARALRNLGYDGRILIVAGDKVIRPRIVERLVVRFEEEKADFAFVVGRRERWPGSGRIVRRSNGGILANVEVLDARYARAVQHVRNWMKENPGKSMEGPTLIALLNEIIRRPDKARQLFPDLHREAELGPVPPTVLDAFCPTGADLIRFRDAGGEEHAISPEDVEASPEVNLSVYLGRADCLYRALAEIHPSPITGEEYLTDVIQILASSLHPSGRPHRLTAVMVEEDEDVLGFNTPEELEAIETALAEEFAIEVREPMRKLGKKADEWRTAFEQAASGSGGLAERLKDSYARESNAWSTISTQYARLVRKASEVFGNDASFLLLRSPGRINLMGRHIDHQGGRNNLLAIPREVRLAVRPRKDDRFVLMNLDEKRFPIQEFRLGSLIGSLPWTDWPSVLAGVPAERIAHRKATDWGFYAEAAALRLQERFRDREIRGLDVIVEGDIPTGSGLSSSSALVVGLAMALVETNGLPITPKELVELCGEAEHYVGTRGGAGDHAAILLSEPGTITSVSFFPFEVMEQAPFPEGTSLAVCYSGIEARKAATARDRFNARVGAYHIARELIRRTFPDLASRIEHLRDLQPDRLGIPIAEAYRLLASLPVRTGREKVLAGFPPGPERNRLEQIFAAHREPEEGYPVRGVALYGIAECERAALCPRFLRLGKVKEIGNLMRISHASEVPEPPLAGSENSFDDRTLARFIEDAERAHSTREEKTALWRRPGWYGCSTPEIENMIRIAENVPGVLGAQLSGAGLGGCIMVLCEKSSFRLLREQLEKNYYAPLGMNPEIIEAVPVRGCEILAP